MSLPLSWVERIFKKLSFIYGRDFLVRWEGLEMCDVKTDWAHELSCFENKPEAIKNALQSLPTTKPPTVLEFKRLCISCPDIEFKALPSPTPDPVFVKKIVGEMKKSSYTNDPKSWARRLKARHSAGETLNVYQVFCYKEALKNDHD